MAALASLGLVVLLTRFLSAPAFATYSVVIATYAFGLALIGTTINTRIIETVSSQGYSRLHLVASRDFPAIGGCILVAVGATLITHPSPSVMAAAGFGMLGMLVSQLAGSFLLGLRRFWSYAVLVTMQMVLWDATAFIALTRLPPNQRLAGALIAVGMGGLPGTIYLLLARVVAIARHNKSNPHTPVSAIGVASLALWVLASGDRLILARYSLTSLATYVATYGLLERVFRTLTTAEMQQRLPNAFRTYANTGYVKDTFSWVGITVLTGSALILAVCTPTAVSLISGGNYRPTLAMSVTLSLGMAAMLAAVPPFVTLIASGRVRISAVIAIVAAGTNIVGNLILAAHFGTASATALTLLGYLIWLAGITIAARQHERKKYPPKASMDEVTATEQPFV